MNVIVGRPAEGITINPLEFVLDQRTMKPLVFSSESAAADYMKRHGCTDEDLYWLTFKPVTGAKCPKCGWPLVESDVGEYDFTCVGCDEDFYRFEVKGAG